MDDESKSLKRVRLLPFNFLDNDLEFKMRLLVLLPVLSYL